MDVLFLEPFYGGAHKYFVDHLRRYVPGKTRLISTPDRKWQWRMRASGLYFADKVCRLRRQPEVIFASSFLNVAEFRGALPAKLRSIPVVLYFHENQFAYPNQNADIFDFQFAIFQMSSAVSADRVIFNSCYNRDSFLAGAAKIPARFRMYFPTGLSAQVARKSCVMPVPIPADCLKPANKQRSGPLQILWNHRWEHDKNPEEFFDVMRWLDRKGYDFIMNVCGEQYLEMPAIFKEVRIALKHRIGHWGFAPSRRDYLKILRASDVVVSTSRQEFFGVAMMEAVAAGCRPIVPDRLSYKELYPDECRYKTKVQWRTLLSRMMHDPTGVRSEDSRHIAEKYNWVIWGKRYEELLREVAGIQ